MNESVWNYDAGKLREIYSHTIHTNAKESGYQREKVARHNIELGLPNPYRVVYYMGAALVAHTIAVAGCPVWHSSEDLSPGERGSVAMYQRRLNRRFGHLVESVRNKHIGYDVYPRKK